MHEVCRGTCEKVQLEETPTKRPISLTSPAPYIPWSESTALRWAPVVQPSLQESLPISTSSLKSEVVVVPKNRWKHACTTWQGQLYLYGGRSGHYPLKDLWVWSLTSLPFPIDGKHRVCVGCGVISDECGGWRCLEVGGSRPPPLEGHSMVAYKGHLYIFGGTFGFPDSDDCPLWIYSIEFELCRQWGVHGEVVVPQSRRGHSAVIHAGGMHVFGGYIDMRGSTAELWTFDMESESWHLAWSPAVHSSCGPAPRHGQSAVAEDGALWIYGGMTDLVYRGDLWRWSFRIGQWCRIRFSRGPGHLAHHSCATVNGQMIIMGGENGQDSDETWLFDFGNMSWKQAVHSGARPHLAPHQTLCVIGAPLEQRSISEPVMTRHGPDVSASQLTPTSNSNIRPNSCPQGIPLSPSPRLNQVSPYKGPTALNWTAISSGLVETVPSSSFIISSNIRVENCESESIHNTTISTAVSENKTSPDDLSICESLEWLQDMTLEDVEDCGDDLFNRSANTLIAWDVLNSSFEANNLKTDDSKAAVSDSITTSSITENVSPVTETCAFRNPSLSVSSYRSETSVSNDTGYLSRSSVSPAIQNHSCCVLVHIGARENNVGFSPLVVWCSRIS